MSTLEQENKLPRRFPLKLILIAAVLLVLIIAGSIGGYFLWLESTYQTAEANAMVDDAMTHYETAKQQADTTVAAIGMVQILVTYSGTEEKTIDSETIAKAQAQLANARKSFATSKAEAESYQSGMESGSLYGLKLKDDYQEYLAKRRETAGELVAYMKDLESAITQVDKIINNYNLALQSSNIPRPSGYESPTDYYNQTMQVVNAVRAEQAASTELAGMGVLNKEYQEADKFFSGCVDRLSEYGSAVNANEFDRADSLFNDYEGACSGQPWDDAYARAKLAWNDSLTGFYSRTIEALTTRKTEIGRLQEDASRLKTQMEQ